MPFSKRNRVYIHNGLKTSCKELLLDDLERKFNLGGISGVTTPREVVEKDNTVSVKNKERLSLIATSIRGISTALSSVSIDLKITSIVIVTKINDASLPPKCREVVEWLIGSRPEITVSVQDVFKDLDTFGYSGLHKQYQDSIHRLKFWTLENLNYEPNKYDMVVTLGGDGTVLFTSWMFQQVVPPVLSFGMGSLGFMTDNNFKDYKEKIGGCLDNGIQCALRMRFAAVVMRANTREGKGEKNLREEIAKCVSDLEAMSTHTPEDEFVILNDIVVDRGPNPNVTMTELYGNFEFITNISADGVVLSTPTGSTAYSMSAGGSLVHPEIGATLISPICPHSLSFRPLVLPDSMIVSIGVPYDARSSAYASFDGRERIEIKRGDFLIVAASRFPFPKVTSPGDTSTSWVKQLGKNLHWNEGRRLKPFS